MAKQARQPLLAPPSGRVTDGTARWPVPVLAAIVLAGFISPLICFAGAGATFALADREQGVVLAAAGLVHLWLRLTLLADV